jgi:3-hydroxyanthranilate 3,4-dioxygenase
MPDDAMNLFSSTDLKRWIEENKPRFDPPYKTNHVIAHHDDFIVMILRGPNARLDFHIEAGEEFFYQIEGDIEIHLKPGTGRREIVKVRAGEMFLCPAGLPHSPRRPEGSWGLVIERRRKADENEEFIWFCERCDEKVLARTVIQGDPAAQVRRIYETFNAETTIRTCGACGYVFPPTPMVERLSFVGPHR